MIKTYLFIATPDMPEVEYVHLFIDEADEGLEGTARLDATGSSC